MMPTEVGSAAVTVAIYIDIDIYMYVNHISPSLSSYCSLIKLVYLIGFIIAGVVIASE